MRPFADNLISANLFIVAYLINILCSEPIPCNKNSGDNKIIEACEFLTERDVEIVQIPTTEGRNTPADEYEEILKQKEVDYDSKHWDTYYATQQPAERDYGESRNINNNDMLLNIKPITHKPERKAELRDALFSNTIENDKLENIETHTKSFIDSFVNYNKLPPKENDKKKRNWLEYTQHRTVGEMLTNRSSVETRRDKYAKLKVKPSRQNTSNVIEPYRSSIKSYLYKHLYRGLTSPKRRKMLFKEKHQSSRSKQNNSSTELKGHVYQNDNHNQISDAGARNEDENIRHAIEREIKLAKHAAMKKPNTVRQYAPIPHQRKRKAKGKLDSYEKRKHIKTPKPVQPPSRKNKVQIQITTTTVKSIPARKKSFFQDPEYFINLGERNEVGPVTVSTENIKTVFKEPMLFTENGGVDEAEDDEEDVEVGVRKKQLTDETEIGVVKKTLVNTRAKTAAPVTKKVIYYYWAKVRTTIAPKTTEANEFLHSTDIMGYEYISNVKDKYTIANDEYGERDA